MDEGAVTKNRFTTTPPASLSLRMGANQWSILTNHLFPGDDDEHGAALLCGHAFVDGKMRLLVREVITAVDGVEYVPGTLGYRHLTGAFVTRQLRRASREGLVYLAVHNHYGTGKVAFSRPDMASHERGYPTLLSLNTNPVGALVIAHGAVAGDIWLSDGTRRSVDTTIVVGDAILELTDGYDSTTATAAAPQYARQALMFGDEGQQLLGRLKVSVVGAGGVGMLAVQALARLGVGSLVVIDPDHVTISNLSRLPEARRSDAVGRFGDNVLGKVARRLGWNKPTLKVDLARRVATGANPDINFTGIEGDIADDHVARQIIDSDFVILAADTMLAREVVNQISYQYLIPTLQVGSKVVVSKGTGEVTDVFGVVRSLGTNPGCLRCNDLINIRLLQEEMVATKEQRKNQRYIDEPDIAAPSVITLNAMATGWAANDFLHYAIGLGRPSIGYRLLRIRPVSEARPQLTIQQPYEDPACHVCGKQDYAVRGKGDAADLPTRI